MKKFKIFVDLDDTAFKYTAAWRRARKLHPEQPYPQSQYGFFTNLEPMENAISRICQLWDHGHDLRFLTAPSVLNPISWMEKRISIEKHFGLDACYRLDISTDKSQFIGDFLVDNRFDSNRQNEFKGELILFGSETFKNWDYVYDYIMLRAGE